jgi:hypothetical protein
VSSRWSAVQASYEAWNGIKAAWCKLYDVENDTGDAASDVVGEGVYSSFKWLSLMPPDPALDVVCASLSFASAKLTDRL